jgi:hypothetical protein
MACAGLFPNEGSQCEQWKDFAEFLQLAQSAKNVCLELHDAALHMMREVNAGTGTSTERQMVWQQLKKHKLLDWFIELQRLDNQTHHKRVIPWIWRT